jgi:hypothetical protein
MAAGPLAVGKDDAMGGAMGGAAGNYSWTILSIRWVPRSFPLVWVNGWVLLLELVLVMVEF